MNNLRIPTKTLDDNYKLEDFQKDYLFLFDLYSKPVKIDIATDGNSMKVLNESGRTTYYVLRYSNGVLTEVYNSTDDIRTTINRGGF